MSGTTASGSRRKMVIFKLFGSRATFWVNLLWGAGLGFVFATTEYVARLDSLEPQAYLPLLLRACVLGMLIVESAAVFEHYSREKFLRKRFWYLVLVRAFFYALMISFWLGIINGVWLSVDLGLPFGEAIRHYFVDASYWINLPAIFLILILLLGLFQINSLHRRGELLRFVLGRYHEPKEINRLFCFIDLKDSTTIAEQLGHLQFGSFLKDCYADMTFAIRQTEAEVYQYVGDEIILSWPPEVARRRHNAIYCFFLIRQTMEAQRQKYMRRYGVYPRFKAAMHGGPVVVTWVGEVKKEIMYLGDVLNTTARILENCKRLQSDFLISEDVLERVGDLGPVRAVFMEETAPRGKEKKVRIYRLEDRGAADQPAF